MRARATGCTDRPIRLSARSDGACTLLPQAKTIAEPLPGTLPITEVYTSGGHTQVVQRLYSTPKMLAGAGAYGHIPVDPSLIAWREHERTGSWVGQLDASQAADRPPPGAADAPMVMPAPHAAAAHQSYYRR